MTREELNEIYRRLIPLVRALADLLEYECPVVEDKEEKLLVKYFRRQCHAERVRLMDIARRELDKE